MCKQSQRTYKQRPLDELRGLAYLGKPGGIPGPLQVHLQGVWVVPNLSHWECYQTLSTQQDTTGLIPCDDSQPCCQGSDGPPTRRSCPAQSEAGALWSS